eukprot:jgi/Ulvmu1/1629/UM113_0006.1
MPDKTPPRSGANHHERVSYVRYDLDTLDEQEFLNGFVTEPGPANRRQGGQAVVQFAKDRRARLLYAVKLFLSRSVFEDECGIYTHSENPLGRFLPALRNIAGDGPACTAPPVCDAHGHKLPPCIGMEKGESLDMWKQPAC